MRFDWILLSPAGPYAVLAMGLTLFLFLFITLKRDMRVGETRWRNKLKALEQRLDELSKSSDLQIVTEPPRSGLSPATRSQALQMHRRGAAPPEIAAALALTKNEVDLMLKVHQIVLSTVPAARSASL